MKRKPLPNLMSGVIDAAKSVRMRAVITRETVYVYVDDRGYFWTSDVEDVRMKNFLVGRYTHRNQIGEVGDALLLRLQDVIKEAA